MAVFRRILVGWDGSRDAAHALRCSLQLASELKAEVVVLTVLKRPPNAETADETDEELAGRRAEIASEVEAAVRQAPPASDVRLHHEVVDAAQPAAGLERYADEHGFDLLVVGRHGRDRAVHRRVGGVAEHQVRHSRGPVLVVGSD